MSWADRARGSAKPLAATPNIECGEWEDHRCFADNDAEGGPTSTATPSTHSSPHATPQPQQQQQRRPGGEGLVASCAGRLGSDAWSHILAYCPYDTVLHAGATCAPLRRLAMAPRLWQRLIEAHTLQYELATGHAAPLMAFSFPVDMSRVVTRSLTEMRTGCLSSGRRRETAVDETNEAAAEFVRHVRFLSRSETRMWHLKEFCSSYAPLAESDAIRMGFATSYDAVASATTSVRSAVVPVTVFAIDRSGPFLKPSDVSTVFSHQAANAMAACRIRTTDVTASYSDLFLHQLGQALGASALHSGVGRTLVSAVLAELSLPEALQCVAAYSRGTGAATASLLEMLLSDITIDEHETRYFAIRQLSSEANIGIVFVDPILTLVIAAGPGSVH